MPQVAATDLNTLRDLTPHMTKLGLAVRRPSVCVTAEVSGGTLAATLLTLTNISTTSTPERHFCVWAGSSAGLKDGGKARMKTLSGSTLTVGINNINWSTYRYITIYNLVEPHVILPDLKNKKEDWDISYTDENEDYHPLARIGCPAVAILDGAASAIVEFYSYSLVMASGASISSHAWVFPSGSPSTSTSAGSAASPISVTWTGATGHTPHIVKYTVTDSNGKTHIRYNPVWIFNTIDDAYADFELESLSGSYDSGGWTARVRVFGDATETEFPEDAMVCIFAQDWYAGHKTSIGGQYAYRENVVFVGWIARDSVHKDADTGAVTFDLLGPTEMLRRMNSWPANLEDKNSPDDWHQLHNMTCNLAYHYIMTQRTTMDHICDVYVTPSTKRMKYIDIPEGDPYSQIDEYIMKPIGARLLSNRQGMFIASQNPNLRPTSERSDIPIVMTLGLEDIRSDPGLELAEEDQGAQVSQVDFVGFGYSGADVDPYYSLAPQYQYDHGTVQKVDGIRADSQSEANTLAGLYLANLNNNWREVRVPSFNYRIWDIAPEEYTLLTLDVTQTKRGLIWANQYLICRAVEMEFDRDKSMLYVTPTFERDTSAAAGVVNPDYPDEPPDNPEPPAPVYPPITPVGDSLFVFDNVNGCYYCPPNSTIWEARNGARSAIADQQGGWDPFYWTPGKNGSRDAELAILWACQVGKLWRSKDGGKTWEDRTPITDPPNDAADSPAPTVANLTFVVRTDNIHADKNHYFLAKWQNGSSQWRAWLLKTADDGLSYSWQSLQGSGAASGGAGWYYANSEHSYSAGSQAPSYYLTAADRANILGSDIAAYAIVEGNQDGPGQTSMTWILNMGGLLSAANKLDYYRSGSAGPGNFVANVIVSVSTDAVNWTSLGTYTFEKDGVGWIDWNLSPSQQVRYVKLEWQQTGNAFHWISQLWMGALRFYETSTFTGDSGYGMCPIWMDTDSQDGTLLWITLWNQTAGKLVLQKRYTSDLSLVTEYDLGLCTAGEFTAKTYVAYPRTPPYDKTYCAVYGRMQNPFSLANPAHIIRTINGGTDFALVESGWGADYCGALEIDTEVGGTRTYSAVRNSASAVPKFYRGQNGVAYVSDFPFASGSGVFADALTGAAGKIAFGVDTAGATMVVRTTTQGVTWDNITNNLPITGSIKSAVYP